MEKIGKNCLFSLVGQWLLFTRFGPATCRPLFTRFGLGSSRSSVNFGGGMLRQHDVHQHRRPQWFCTSEQVACTAAGGDPRLNTPNRMAAIGQGGPVPCHAMSWFHVPCHILPCRAMPYFGVSWRVMNIPCHAMSGFLGET